MTDIVTTRRHVPTVLASVAHTASIAGAYGETPSDPWVELPRVRAARLTLRAGLVDDAQLYERFSEIGQRTPGDPLVSTDPWTDLEGRFVRVTVPIDEEDGGPVVWYGYVPQGSRNRVPHRREEGDPAVAVSRLSGVQQWRAVGLEWFLGRRQVDSAVIADRSSGAAPGATTRIERPMTFNGGDNSGTADRNRPRGNKSITQNAFVSPQSVNDRPRAVAVAAAAFTKANSTITLVADALAPSFAAVERVDPFGWSGSTAAPPVNLPQATERMAGLAGDLIRLARDATDAFWEVDGLASIEWNGETMLEYLLERHGPVDDSGDPAPLAYVLHSGGDVLRALRPTVPTEGRDVLSLIGTIVSRSRGVIWSCQTVTPDEDETLTAPEVRLAAHSLAGTAIGLPGGGSFPANANQHTVDPDDDPFRDAVVVSVNRESRYDRVRARGARITSTVTLSHNDDTLVPDWDYGQELEYLAGASGDAGYAELSVAEKKRANDARRAEPRLSRVFSAFRLPATWDGKTGGGDDFEERSAAFPRIDRDGDVDGEFPYYAPELRVLARTRIAEPYQGGSADEMMAPFAVIETPDGWRYLHNLNDSAAGSGERLASYRLARADGGVAFRLYSSKGLAHTLASERWTDAEPSRLEPELNYYKIKLTVTLEADGFAEAVFGDTPAAGVMVEELLIDAGPGYRLDLIPGGTIMWLEDGQRVPLTDDYAVLRDDRAALEKIAAMAHAWYRTPTQAIRLRLRRPVARLALGDYLTSVGRAGQADPVGTVVAEIDYDLGESQTTTIATTGVERAGLGAIE